MKSRTLTIRNLTETSEKNPKSLLQLAQESNDQQKLDAYYKLAIAFYSREDKEGLNHDAIDDIQHRRTILFWAIACKQSEDETERLIQLGSKTDEQYFDDQQASFSPLYLALDLPHTPAINVLLGNNPALIKTEDHKGSTPAHRAVEKDDPDMLAALFEHSKNLSEMIAGTSGYTPLHVAAKLGHVQCATWLLENTNSINLQDANGLPALYHAIENGKDEIVRLLLKHGARPTTEHPIDHANLHPHVSVAMKLMKYVSDRKTKPEYLTTNYGLYNGGYSVADKVNVSNMVINNILAGNDNPLEGLTRDQLNCLKNASTGRLAAPLFGKSGPIISPGASPNNSRTPSPDHSPSSCLRK